jgi:coenzyme F420-0:L-glutamate ligase/coenzyme F420-1:gamma-L-glutamate ligase
MKTISEVIKQRRSVRKYRSIAVPLEIIEKVLEAARNAPSAHNSQPWRFIVVTDELVKHVLSEAMAKAWAQDLIRDGVDARTRVSLSNSSVEKFTKAPLLLLCCLTLKDMTPYSDAKRQNIERDLAVQSLAAAIQNMLLVAHSEGLGACWYCAPIFCKPAVRRALKIPKDIEPQALITLGFPAEKPVAPKRKSTKEFVHRNKWGNSLGEL